MVVGDAWSAGQFEDGSIWWSPRLPLAFAATFGEQMMVTLSCHQLAQVLQLLLVSK